MIMRPPAALLLVLTVATGCAGPAAQTRPEVRPRGEEPWVVLVTPPQWRAAPLRALASTVRQTIGRGARVHVVLASGEEGAANGAPSSGAAAVRDALERAHEHYVNMRMSNARRELESALEASRTTAARGLTPGQLARIHLYLAAVSQAQGSTSELRDHAEAAVVFQPDLQPDADLFSPPIRQAIERARAARQTVETQVLSDPPGATVHWDGAVRGKTPLKIADSAKGEHSLLLEHPLCLPWQDMIRVSTNAELRIKLKPIPAPDVAAALRRHPGLGAQGEIVLGARSLVWLKEEPDSLTVEVIAGQGAGRTVRLASGSPAASVEAAVRQLQLTGSAPQELVSPGSPRVTGAGPPEMTGSAPLGTSPGPDRSDHGPSVWRRYWWVWTIAGAAVVGAGVAIPLAVTSGGSGERGIHVTWPQR